MLGVIKTMGSITEPPEMLGEMIGGALVGTFLGVFLAYGMVGPMATRLKDVVEEEGAFYKIIRACWSPTCTATPRRSRWRSAAAACPPARSPASPSWKKR